MEEIGLITMTAKVSKKSFTGVPVHFKHDFSGVPKVQTGFHLSKRSPHSLKKVSRKTGQIWRSKYLKSGILRVWVVVRHAILALYVAVVEYCQLLVAIL